MNPALRRACLFGAHSRQVRAPNLDLDKLRGASFGRDFHGFGVKQSTRTADLLGGLQGTPSTQNVDVVALLQEVISQQQSAFVGKGLELSAEVTSEGLFGLNTDKPRRRQRLQPCHLAAA